MVSEGKGIGVKALWDTYCNETIHTMVRGSRYLAKIREAVWIIGKSDTTIKSKNNNVVTKDIKDLYGDKSGF